MHKGKILMVEDKDEFRTIYGDRLRFGGYDVVDAKNGKEALEKLAKGDIELVMTDINMPEMDGYELITAIRADEKLKALPIMVMSVFDSGEHLTKARELGANEYLIKGMSTPNAVIEKIDAMLTK